MMANERSERKTKDLILAVDDVQRNLQVLGNLLREENYRMSFAGNGEQALKMVSRTIPDLILLDIMMPGMDGYQVCQQLKSSPQTKDIPIIFLTGKSDTEDIIKGFEIGGVDYVTKPFNGTELLARIKTHLELKHAREELTEKNEQITASIRCAKRLQEAILPLDEVIAAAVPEHFIIFKPKDIVSGDFYWFGQVDGKMLVAAVDCTGHGIPGACMSMMANTLLNKIVLEQKIVEPAKILENLNLEVRRALKQEQEKCDVTDGMDVCLCLLEKKKNKVIFAGAMRPLYIMKGRDPKNESEPGDDAEVMVIKGDRCTIGGRRKKTDGQFTDNEFTLSPGDVFYLTSDGYMDQNNSEDKKFGSKRFEKALEDIAGLEMSKQKEILLEKLAEHQGEEKQRDDILLIGVKM